MENGKMNVDLVSEILDRQPVITTLVQRTVNEHFGDERLIEAANPDQGEAEKECWGLVEKVRELDGDLYLALDEAITTLMVESERGAHRLGIIVGLRRAGKEELIPEVAQQI